MHKSVHTSLERRKIEKPDSRATTFELSFVHSSKEMGEYDFQPIEILLKTGKFLFRKLDVKQALHIFNLCASRLPKDPEIQYWIGACNALSSNPALAAESFESAIQLAKNQPIMLQKIGDFFLDRKQFDQCRIYYMRVLQGQECLPQTCIDFALKLFAAGFYADVLECVSKVPEQLISHLGFEITWSSLMLNKNETAFHWFKNIPTNHPSYVDCCVKIAELQCQKGDYSASYNLFYQVLALGQLQEHGYFGLASALFKLRRFHEAEGFCKAAIQLFPKTPKFLYLLSDIYATAEKTNDSVRILRKIVLSYRDNHLALTKLCHYYEIIEDHANALKFLLLIQSSDSSNLDLLSKIALTYLKMGNIDMTRYWKHLLESAIASKKSFTHYSDKESISNRDDTNNITMIKTAETNLHSIKKLLEESSAAFSRMSFIFQQPQKNLTIASTTQQSISIQTSLILDVYKQQDTSIFQEITDSTSQSIIGQMNAVKTNDYTASFERLFEFVFKNVNFEHQRCPNRMNRNDCKLAQFILECAHFVNYDRHAMNCDVICSEMFDPFDKPRETISTVKCIVKSKLISSLLRSLDKLSTYQSNLSIIAKAIATKIQFKKSAVLKKEALPTRLRK